MEHDHLGSITSGIGAVEGHKEGCIHDVDIGGFARCLYQTSM